VTWSAIPVTWSAIPVKWSTVPVMRSTTGTAAVVQPKELSEVRLRLSH
jgi:hypothetical protein